MGPAYINRRGKTLYGLDMRTLLRAGPDPAQYCVGPCAELWEPLLAPPESIVNIQFPRGGGPQAALPSGFVQPQTAPDWTVIKGPQGPQWVYKGWHLVFTHKDEASGSAAFDGAEGRSWNVLRFIPPVPTIVAPGNVRPVFVDGAYAFADTSGRVLFTGRCTRDYDKWQPFSGGLASAGIGEWRIDASGDVPQWRYRGNLAFVAADGTDVPVGGKVLRP